MQTLPLILFVEKKKTTPKQWKGSTVSRIQGTLFSFTLNLKLIVFCLI